MSDPVTLAHLITHTSGLPALPADFYVRALPAWRTNPYARYSGRARGRRLPAPPAPAPARHPLALLQLRRRRPRSRPRGGDRAPPWDDLLTESGAASARPERHRARARGPDTDAIGHRKDGTTPVPAARRGGFQAAGAVRATPHDLLTFLEAHLDPRGRARWPPPCARYAARCYGAVSGTGTCTPSPGSGTPPTHGPMYFHGGATLGQQTFLGFRPDTGTALAAVCTRRFRPRPLRPHRVRPARGAVNEGSPRAAPGASAPGPTRCHRPGVVGLQPLPQGRSRGRLPRALRLVGLQALVARRRRRVTCAPTS